LIYTGNGRHAYWKDDGSGTPGTTTVLVYVPLPPNFVGYGWACTNTTTFVLYNQNWALNSDMGQITLGGNSLNYNAFGCPECDCPDGPFSSMWNIIYSPNCIDQCIYYLTGEDLTSDGHCDDGGPASRHSTCSLGTDCTDCGVRNIPPTQIIMNHTQWFEWANGPFSVDYPYGYWITTVITLSNPFEECNTEFYFEQSYDLCDGDFSTCKSCNGSYVMQTSTSNTLWIINGFPTYKDKTKNTWIVYFQQYWYCISDFINYDVTGRVWNLPSLRSSWTFNNICLDASHLWFPLLNNKHHSCRQSYYWNVDNAECNQIFDFYTLDYNNRPIFKGQQNHNVYLQYHTPTNRWTCSFYSLQANEYAFWTSPLIDNTYNTITKTGSQFFVEGNMFDLCPSSALRHVNSDAYVTSLTTITFYNPFIKGDPCLISSSGWIYFYTPSLCTTERSYTQKPTGFYCEEVTCMTGGHNSAGCNGYSPVSKTTCAELCTNASGAGSGSPPSNCNQFTSYCQYFTYFPASQFCHLYSSTCSNANGNDGWNGREVYEQYHYWSYWNLSAISTNYYDGSNIPSPSPPHYKDLPSPPITPPPSFPPSAPAPPPSDCCNHIDINFGDGLNSIYEADRTCSGRYEITPLLKVNGKNVYRKFTSVEFTVSSSFWQYESYNTTRSNVEAYLVYAAVPTLFGYVDKYWLCVNREDFYNILYVSYNYPNYYAYNVQHWYHVYFPYWFIMAMGCPNCDCPHSSYTGSAHNINNGYLFEHFGCSTGGECQCSLNLEQCNLPSIYTYCNCQRSISGTINDGNINSSWVLRRSQSISGHSAYRWDNILTEVLCDSCLSNIHLKFTSNMYCGTTGIYADVSSCPDKCMGNYIKQTNSDVLWSFNGYPVYKNMNTGAYFMRWLNDWHCVPYLNNFSQFSGSEAGDLSGFVDRGPALRTNLSTDCPYGYNFNDQYFFTPRIKMPDDCYQNYDWAVGLNKPAGCSQVFKIYQTALFFDFVYRGTKFSDFYLHRSNGMWYCKQCATCDADIENIHNSNPYNITPDGYTTSSSTCPNTVTYNSVTRNALSNDRFYPVGWTDYSYGLNHSDSWYWLLVDATVNVTFDCCSTINISGNNLHQNFLSSYTMIEDYRNRRPVYYNSFYYLFYYSYPASNSGGWLIGLDYTVNQGWIASSTSSSSCPDAHTSSWLYYDGTTWVTDGSLNFACL
tara:strand:+ start:189 stop:3776 length:3588 start_codon:yes stop_codon:yes gene_type:complete